MRKVCTNCTIAEDWKIAKTEKKKVNLRNSVIEKQELKTAL